MGRNGDDGKMMRKEKGRNEEDAKGEEDGGRK